MTCDVVGIDPGIREVVGSISFFRLGFDFCLGLMTFLVGTLIFWLKGFDFCLGVGDIFWGGVDFVGLLPDASLASCLLFIQEVEGYRIHHCF